MDAQQGMTGEALHKNSTAFAGVVALSLFLSVCAVGVNFSVASGFYLFDEPSVSWNSATANLDATVSHVNERCGNKEEFFTGLLDERAVRMFWATSAVFIYLGVCGVAKPLVFLNYFLFDGTLSDFLRLQFCRCECDLNLWVRA